MKEIIIFFILVFFTGLVYWGVEPLAHSVMHPHIAPANFNFTKEAKEYEKHQIQEAKEVLERAKKEVDKKIAKSALDKTIDKANKINTFWDEIEKIDLSKGDAIVGKNTFINAGCIGCHGLSSESMPSPMDAKSAGAAFGVVPPDLSSAGYLYTPIFLAALIKKPNIALHVESKFNETHPFPMNDFFGAGGADINKEIADIIAYLVSIRPKKMNDREVFADACQRCHDMKYDKLKAYTDLASLQKYMGSTPPDLSIIIRARSKHYLETFINDPQKGLQGTSMPRVGLTKASQEQVLNYLEKIGDSKKDERENLGYKIMLYFLILSIFATAWKIYIWKRVH